MRHPKPERSFSPFREDSRRQRPAPTRRFPPTPAWLPWRCSIDLGLGLQHPRQSAPLWGSRHRDLSCTECGHSETRALEAKSCPKQNRGEADKATL